MELDISTQPGGSGIEENIEREYPYHMNPKKASEFD